ncbi:MAG: endo-1,4-beta-xylanase [Chitinophagaceae bacterium]|nr:endo-1,4-beta-xylanase [Chitinophagaceae bacterium]
MNNRRQFLKQGTSGIALSVMPHWLLADSHRISPKRRDWLRMRAAEDDDVLSKARQDIPQIRMSDMEIQLLASNGKPVKHTPVEIVQQRHSFSFGDCNPDMDKIFRQEGADSEKLRQYRRLFSDALNTVNATCYWTERPRNNMAKTEEYQGEPYYDGFANTVDWGNANGLTVKGHPLFWPVEKAIPEWLKRYDYPTQLKFLEVRLRQLVGRFKGKVKVWDAVNEMLWEPALKNLSKRQWPHFENVDDMADYISFVMQIVRSEDADAVYTLNDYGLELPWPKPLKSNTGIDVTPQLQRQRYIELIQRLRTTGHHPNALGLQCHDGWQKPADQMAFYSEMAKAGLPLHVTEFWAKTDHLKKSGIKGTAVNGDFITERFENSNAPVYTQAQIDLLQADFVEQYLTCAFGHPSVEAFIFWGFMGMGVEWKVDDSTSYELKPVYHRVKKLIHEQWKTNLKLETNGDGMLRFKAFHGDYTVRYPLINGGPMSAAASFTTGAASKGNLRLETII